MCDLFIDPVFRFRSSAYVLLSTGVSKPATPRVSRLEHELQVIDAVVAQWHQTAGMPRWKHCEAIYDRLRGMEDYQEAVGAVLDAHSEVEQAENKIKEKLQAIAIHYGADGHAHKAARDRARSVLEWSGAIWDLVDAVTTDPDSEERWPQVLEEKHTKQHFRYLRGLD